MKKRFLCVLKPNGNLIVPSLAVDEAAMLEKKGSMKTVDLTCTTGTPDQLRRRFQPISVLGVR